jgi:hypothetical protein
MVLMRRIDHPDRRGTPTSRLLAAPALVDASSRRAFGFTNNPGQLQAGTVYVSFTDPQ